MQRSDLASAIVLLIFGLAVTFESWRMPRYESVGGSIYSAPGLVPGLLGVIIALLGAVMLLRSLAGRRRAEAGPAAEHATLAGAANGPAGGAPPAGALPEGALPEDALDIGLLSEAAISEGALGATAAADDEEAAAAAAGARSTGAVVGEGGGAGVTDAPAPASTPSNARVIVTLVLGVAFAAGLIGRMPFWLAVFIFVFVSIAYNERDALKRTGSAVRMLLIAATIAGATGFAVPFVFEKVFLVTLP